MKNKSENERQSEFLENVKKLKDCRLNHSTILGPVCEKLILADLKKTFINKKINFAPGIIIKKGDKISPQIDIIGYVGKENVKKHGFVLVNLEKVKFCIEIKKSTGPGHFKLKKTGKEGSFLKQMQKIRAFVEKTPLFFITFGHDFRNSGCESLTELKKICYFCALKDTNTTKKELKNRKNCINTYGNFIKELNNIIFKIN